MRRLVVPAAAAGLAVGLLVTAAPASAQDYSVSVAAGFTLHAGDRLISSNQAFTMTVQTDGNVVERHGATAVWTTNTPGNPGATLDVQSDGNLVVRSSTSRALWNSGSAGHRATQLQLGDDGELGMFASTGPAFWTNGLGASRTGLTAGQSVRSDRLEQVNSPSGRFKVYPIHGAVAADEMVDDYGTSLWIRDDGRGGGAQTETVLSMQTDGNLVLRGTNGVAYWSTGTRGAGNRFTVQDDGNFVVRRPNGSAAWASGTTSVLLGVNETARAGQRFVDTRYQNLRPGATVVQTDGNVVRYEAGSNQVEWTTGTAGNPGARLTMQSDGNLVLRRPDGRAVWQSGTSHCGPKAVFDTVNALVFAAGHGTAWSELGGRTGTC